YEPGVEWPLVFNLHGLGSNGAQQGFYTAFTAVADTANFILCHPNGTDPFGLGQGWDVNFPIPPVEVDDLGCIDRFIDTIHANYNINLGRVYSTGMSNGGYMSYKLACELTDRIQAIASVTGSIVPAELDNCTPSRTIPVMQFHGTNDGVVAYDGSNVAAPIEDVIAYWIDHNECANTPDTTVIEESPTNDQSSAIRISYTDCDTDREVIFYKITDGGHTWPGAALPIPNNGATNQDVNATIEIWRFFSKYGEDIETSNNNITKEESITVFPNPVQDLLTVQSDVSTLLDIQVYNNLGQLILQEKNINDKTHLVSTSNLQNGIYYIHAQTEAGTFSRPFVKQ
ncbi:MAG: T9SS type A sorting domain-containing protein, partial [Saprospiraceae bacterium]